ncbi:MAG: hypothetical protein IAE90_12380 [Ignavibacteria bacterium]|nr:hypothetical protein [Ignavibacteria bacterium]
MKYLLFLVIVVNIAFSQTTNGMYATNVQYIGIVDNRNIGSVEGFNLPGSIGMLKGEMIISLGNNEYWIRNSELTLVKGDVYIFSENLLKNGIPVIDQVNAQYGYVLVTQPGENEAVIYIAGEKGNKTSDPVSIEL